MKAEEFLDRYVDYTTTIDGDLYFHWDEVEIILHDLLELAATRTTFSVKDKFRNVISKKQFSYICDGGELIEVNRDSILDTLEP